MEVKRADNNAASPKGTGSSQGSSTGLLSSIEIKDACIPPWIVCRVCALMGSEGRNFEARYHKFLHQLLSSMPLFSVSPWLYSCYRCFDLIWEIFSFTTERTSIGLNAALETACEKPDQAAAVEGLQESSHAFGIPEATVAPCLGSGFLKGLKYCDGSYTASLSPAWHFAHGVSDRDAAWMYFSAFRWLNQSSLHVLSFCNSIQCNLICLTEWE